MLATRWRGSRSVVYDAEGVSSWICMGIFMLFDSSVNKNPAELGYWTSPEICPVTDWVFASMEEGITNEPVMDMDSSELFWVEMVSDQLWSFGVTNCVEKPEGELRVSVNPARDAQRPFTEFPGLMVIEMRCPGDPVTVRVLLGDVV